MTTFCSTTRENPTSIRRSHTTSKSMSTFPNKTARLICAFHNKPLLTFLLKLTDVDLQDSLNIFKTLKILGSLVYIGDNSKSQSF